MISNLPQDDKGDRYLSCEDSAIPEDGGSEAYWREQLKQTLLYESALEVVQKLAPHKSVREQARIAIALIQVVTGGER